MRLLAAPVLLTATFFVAAVPGRAGAPAEPAGLPGWLPPSLSRPASSGNDGHRAADAQDDSEDRIREQTFQMELATLGIANVRKWRREGTVYRAEAEWYGEAVDLHVDAETGSIKQPERLKGTQVERMLRQQGWNAVNDVKRSGDTFVVQAERDQRGYELRIDAKTGRIEDVR